MRYIKCTCEDGHYCKDAVCLEDVCGNQNQQGFWADWCPNSKKVWFGGAWGNVPPLTCLAQPDYCGYDNDNDLVTEYVNIWLRGNT